METRHPCPYCRQIKQGYAQEELGRLTVTEAFQPAERG
jgi:hypothetical protein